MSVITSPTTSINQGYVRTNNTTVQSSQLVGGSLANTLDLSAIKVVRAFAVLGAATSTLCQVYQTSLTNPAASATSIPTTGVNAPAPFRLGTGDLVIGIGMQSSTLYTTTAFQLMSAGGLASSAPTPAALATFAPVNLCHAARTLP